MKRLISKKDIEYLIGDNVVWKKHPYDKSVYKVTDVLPDGTLFIDNGIQAYTNIKPSVIKPVD